MADYLIAYEVGRDNEGGYVNRKDDKGGETYCGIARNYWPKWRGWAIVDQHKAERGGTIERGTIFGKDVVLEKMVKDFYYENFWKAIKGDDIDSQAVATYIYDWTLTSGGAKKKIQQALGLLADGYFGPVTVEAINNKADALKTIHDLRRAYYMGIVDKDQSQSVNLIGWLTRCTNLYKSLS